jgi:uncharacterized protein
MDDLLGHPVAGSSCEGLVIESLLAVAPIDTSASLYRTSAGAEIDLIIEMVARHGTRAIETKRTRAPKLEKRFRITLDEIRPTRAFIVYGGNDGFSMGNGVEAISLRRLAAALAALHQPCYHLFSHGFQLAETVIQRDRDVGANATLYRIVSTAKVSGND